MPTGIFPQQRQQPVADDVKRIAGVHMLLQQFRRLREHHVPSRHAVKLNLEVVVGGVNAHLDAVGRGRFRGLGHIAAELAVGVRRLAQGMRGGNRSESRLRAKIERLFQVVAFKIDETVDVASHTQHAGIGEKPADSGGRMSAVSGEFDPVVTGGAKSVQALFGFLPEYLMDGLELCGRLRPAAGDSAGAAGKGGDSRRRGETSDEISSADVHVPIPFL